MRVWNASTGQELARHSLGYLAVLVAPKANLLAVTRIQTIVGRTFGFPITLTFGTKPEVPVFQKLPTNFESDIHLIDVFSGKTIRSLHADQSTLALAITPDGHTLAATEEPKRVAIWDVAKGKVVQRIDLDQELFGTFMPLPAALSADGKLLGLRLATVKPKGGAEDRSFSVWDVTTGKQLWRQGTH